MSRRTHGLISLFLFDAACWVGVIAAFLHSVAAGIGTIVAIGAGAVLLISVFCTKCACSSEQCAHLLPGKAAEMFPSKPAGPYRAGELIQSLIGMLFIVATPQIWLIERPIFGVIYWVLSLVAVIEIRIWVCPGCAHYCCPLHPYQSVSDL